MTEQEQDQNEEQLLENKVNEDYESLKEKLESIKSKIKNLLTELKTENEELYSMNQKFKTVKKSINETYYKRCCCFDWGWCKCNYCCECFKDIWHCFCCFKSNIEEDKKK